jgi:hypothetical protein
MADMQKLSGKELAQLMRERICPKITVFSLEADLLQAVIDRLEKSDGLPSGIEEALNMGDGAYRP